MIKNIAITGGTHGNELTGLYIEKLIRDKQLNVQHQSFKVDTLLANPDAIVNNVRFMEADLNRQFGKKQQLFPNCKESKIAQKLQLKYENKRGTHVTSCVVQINHKVFRFIFIF